MSKSVEGSYEFPQQRYTWVHRLHVEVPAESMFDPRWRPENYDTTESYNRVRDGECWRWPRRRQFFDSTSAYRRAHLLKLWGATVRVESQRIEWMNQDGFIRRVTREAK